MKETTTSETMNMKITTIIEHSERFNGILLEVVETQTRNQWGRLPGDCSVEIRYAAKINAHSMEFGTKGECYSFIRGFKAGFGVAATAANKFDNRG